MGNEKGKTKESVRKQKQITANNKGQTKDSNSKEEKKRSSRELPVQKKNATVGVPVKDNKNVSGQEKKTSLENDCAQESEHRGPLGIG